MTTTERRLYQFPLSLYCEKTGWNLDCKGLPWQAVNLMPGPHIPVAWWLARQRTLPILRDGKASIGDSTAIALYLEEHYPQHALLPQDSALRREVLGLEEYFDDIGDHVRRSVWSLAVDSPEVSRIFFHGYAAQQQRLGELMRPLLRLMLRCTFDVWPKQVAASWQRVEEGLALVESHLRKTGSGYLVGDRFTLADLTAASMLAPLIGPPQSPWPDDRVGIEPGPGREQFRARDAGRWVLAMYARHRQSIIS